MAHGTPSASYSSALRSVAKAPPGSYLDVDVGSAAWAACELVALAFGRAGASAVDALAWKTPAVARACCRAPRKAT